MRRQYYYFVTGLPALNIDDTKSVISATGFLTDAKNHLDKADFKLLMLLSLPEDCGDLLRLIYKTADDGRPIQECSRIFWQHYADAMKQKAADPTLPIPADYLAYPKFWHAEILELMSGEELPPFLAAQHRLLEAVYDHCLKARNEFLRSWFAYNRDMQNILTAVNGRKHGIDFAKYLVGGGELVENLSQSHAADFGLGKDHQLFENVLRVWEQNNLLYRERGYDILRWKWISDHNFFNYFNIDRILGYYAQLRILERWQGMDPELGKDVFQDTMDSLANSFSFPEQFNVRSISKK